MKRLATLFAILVMTAVGCLAADTARQKVKVGDAVYPAYKCFKDIQPISVENPVYPARARNEGRGGEVIVGAVVNEKGKVTVTFVAKSTADSDLQHAARTAVANWRFPKIQDGDKAISYVVFVPLSLSPQ